MLSSRLRRRFAIFGIALFAAVQVPPHSSGQNLANASRAASFQDAMMQQVSRKAGFIFSGTVLSVERVASGAGVGIDTVRVIFSVQQGIRGVTTGKTFTLQEWAGLWSNAGSRFRRGERVFLFLYPRSKLGLTSVVGGTFGRFDLDSAWRIAGTNQKPETLVGEPQQPRGLRPRPRGRASSREIGKKIRLYTE